MDKISINVFKSKVPLNIIVLYGILFIIALLWTDRELNPNIALRTIFIIFFSIPLLKYSYLTPVILTIFYCIRVFSIGVGGYLPSQSEFFIILLIIIVLFRIKDRLFLHHPPANIHILLAIVLISNIINLSADYNYAIAILITILLSELFESKYDLKLMETGFVIVTFTLSIVTILFIKDFVIVSTIGYIERAYWVDPNYMASLIAVGVIISMYFLTNTPSKTHLTLLYIPSFILGLIALGLLASRGALFCTIIPCVYIIYKNQNLKKSLTIFLFLFLLIALLIINTDYFSTLIERFDDESVESERFDIWKNSFPIFINSNIITILIGGGSEYSDKICGQAIGEKSFSSHNNFLYFLYSYGIIGLISFVSILFTLYHKNKKNILATALLICFIIICMTLTPFMFLSFWFLLSLILNYSKVK